MSEIKLNINAPGAVLTIASSIKANQYIQNQNIESQYTFPEVLPDSHNQSTPDEKIIEDENTNPPLECEEKNTADNPLIFEESILDNFHGALNDYLWESADIFIFKDWFRLKPKGMPVIKTDRLSYFCYAVSLLDKYRNKEICPNIETWYNALTGNTTKFSKLKGQATANKKGMKESKPIKLEIDRRLAHLRFF